LFCCRIGLGLLCSETISRSGYYGI
jgi:hypothetical protein